MFGLSLASQLIQGSRTWNCVSNIFNLFWTKFNHIRSNHTMPRSRKRHHSRSRSRSRSHSHDRRQDDKYSRRQDSYEKERDGGKRRKIESYDSPTHHKRSVSCEVVDDDHRIEDGSGQEKGAIQIESKSPVSVKNESVENVDNQQSDKNLDKSVIDDIEMSKEVEKEFSKDNCSSEKQIKDECADLNKPVSNDSAILKNEAGSSSKEDAQSIQIEESESDLDSSIKMDATDSEVLNTSLNSSFDSDALKKKLEITPKKVLSPKQIQKRLESEKKRQERERQKLERQKQKDLEKQKLQEEKQKLLEQKQKEKEAKEEQRRKEREEKEEQKRKEREEKEEQKRKEREEKEEQKRKEREEKEQKRKEKEEKEEMKRKEKEQERLKKLQEAEEKNKEKQKLEEQKQKAAAVFANFFVANNKKSEKEETDTDQQQNSYFKSFEIKSDMKLPPPRRNPLSVEEKEFLINSINKIEDQKLYLDEVKSGKQLGKCGKTWPYIEDVDEEDVVLVDETLGETICEDENAQKKQKFRAKFLKFYENRRPPYFGTWRKESEFVKARKPFGQDLDRFNYEEDSDDDWEEEEQGESINGSDDEEKENDEDDYEVDNEFLVPHGHLSEDEIDDEDMAKLSPESLKQKLKLLKDEFDQEIKSKTHKLKPRSLGCIWYNKDGSNVDPAIDRCLKPLAIITNGNIMIKKRSLIFAKKVKTGPELEEAYIPDLLKIIHKNVKKRKILCEEFLTEMTNKGVKLDVSKAKILRLIKQLASWSKASDEATQKNKLCWIVKDDILKKYNLFQ